MVMSDTGFVSHSSCIYIHTKLTPTTYLGFIDVADATLLEQLLQLRFELVSFRIIQ